MSSSLLKWNLPCSWRCEVQLTVSQNVWLQKPELVGSLDVDRLHVQLGESAIHTLHCTSQVWEQVTTRLKPRCVRVQIRFCCCVHTSSVCHCCETFLLQMQQKESKAVIGHNYIICNNSQDKLRLKQVRACTSSLQALSACCVVLVCIIGIAR